jgi:hypothetical protein
MRQGDVLLVKTTKSSIPRGLKVHRGRLILATGEATGHAHVIDDPAAVLWGDELDVRFLEVTAAVDLVHTSTPPDHDTLSIPPGTYRVIRQREFTPEAVRRVAD